jgi:lysophospholipase L1-like esterase
LLLNKKTFIAFWLLSIIVAGNAQPFADDIAAFKKQDAIAFPPKNAILFIGSSSFTNWKDLQSYFPQHTIINRGFGGSSLPDIVQYADDIIFPYQPKQIIIYCGENDLAASDTVSAKTVYRRFLILYFLIRKQLPQVPVVFISLKPSPSRWHLNNKMVEVNTLVKQFISKTPNGIFVDVYPKMLNKGGRPIAEFFLEDSLHMNARGYALWRQLIEPVLKR